jgi:hypothetical protein
VYFTRRICLKKVFEKVQLPLVAMEFKEKEFFSFVLISVFAQAGVPTSHSPQVQYRRRKKRFAALGVLLNSDSTAHTHESERKKTPESHFDAIRLETDDYLIFDSCLARPVAD